MKEMPLVSIIVPIYNVKDYLITCIDSILSQSYSNIEVILVDDGSTDGSAVICDNYAKINKNIKVIHKKNGGLVSARKKGLQEADGDYIQFVDGDDWIHPQMTEKLIFEMLSSNVDLVTCGVYKVNDKKTIVKVYFEEGVYNRTQMEKIIFPQMIFSGEYFESGIYPFLVNKLFRKQILLPYCKKVPDDITIGEDAACVYPLILSLNSISIIEEPFYYYRQNNNSMTHSFRRNQTRNVEKLILFLKDEIKEYEKIVPNILKQMDYYLFFMTELNLVNMAQGGFSNSFLERRKELIHFLKYTDLRNAIKRQDMRVLPLINRILVMMARPVLLDVIIMYQTVKRIIFKECR